MTECKERLGLYDQSIKLVESYSKIIGTSEGLEEHMMELCKGRALAAAREEAFRSANSSEDYEKMIDGHSNDYDINECEKYTSFVASLAGDVVAVQEQIITIDPITKLPLVDPVRNNVCGHVYESASILGVISKNPRTRCPYIGCVNKIVKKSDLTKDEDLKVALSQLSSKQKKRMSVGAVLLDDSTAE